MKILSRFKIMALMAAFVLLFSGAAFAAVGDITIGTVNVVPTEDGASVSFDMTFEDTTNPGVVFTDLTGNPVYDVYEGSTATLAVTSEDANMNAAGQVSFDITGLQPSMDYTIVVTAGTMDSTSAYDAATGTSGQLATKFDATTIATTGEQFTTLAASSDVSGDYTVEISKDFAKNADGDIEGSVQFMSGGSVDVALNTGTVNFVLSPAVTGSPYASQTITDGVAAVTIPSADLTEGTLYTVTLTSNDTSTASWDAAMAAFSTTFTFTAASDDVSGDVSGDFTVEFNLTTNTSMDIAGSATFKSGDQADTTLSNQPVTISIVTSDDTPGAVSGVSGQQATINAQGTVSFDFQPSTGLSGDYMIEITSTAQALASYDLPVYHAFTVGDSGSTSGDAKVGLNIYYNLVEDMIYVEMLRSSDGQVDTSITGNVGTFRLVSEDAAPVMGREATNGALTATNGVATIDTSDVTDGAYTLSLDFVPPYDAYNEAFAEMAGTDGFAIQVGADPGIDVDYRATAETTGTLTVRFYLDKPGNLLDQNANGTISTVRVVKSSDQTVVYTAQNITVRSNDASTRNIAVTGLENGMEYLAYFTFTGFGENNAAYNEDGQNGLPFTHAYRPPTPVNAIVASAVTPSEVTVTFRSGDMTDTAATGNYSYSIAETANGAVVATGTATATNGSSSITTSTSGDLSTILTWNKQYTITVSGGAGALAPYNGKASTFTVGSSSSDPTDPYANVSDASMSDAGVLVIDIQYDWATGTYKVTIENPEIDRVFDSPNGDRLHVWIKNSLAADPGARDATPGTTYLGEKLLTKSALLAGVYSFDIDSNNVDGRGTVMSDGVYSIRYQSVADSSIIGYSNFNKGVLRHNVDSTGSSGCDAGFGIMALIAAAGATVLLRKKD